MLHLDFALPEPFMTYQPKLVMWPWSTLRARENVWKKIGSQVTTSVSATGRKERSELFSNAQVSSTVLGIHTLFNSQQHCRAGLHVKKLKKAQGG